jgi:hypothetical protein
MATARAPCEVVECVEAMHTALATGGGCKLPRDRTAAASLQRATGHLKHRGCLTLGKALGLQIAISRKQCSAFETLPALVALIVATLLVLDDGSHSDLPLRKPLCR